MKILLLTLLNIVITISIYANEGTVSGRVFDKVTNEALIGATVVVEGSTIGVTSDSEGKFTLTGLKSGFNKLVVMYLGYKQLYSSEFLTSNARNVYLELGMEPEAKQIEEVVVKVSAFRRPIQTPNSLQSIGLSEIENSAGSNRDIAKVIQSYPGVGFASSARNDVVIRGGGPGENAYFIDEIEIPNINHFATQGASGGAVSIINADLVSGVDFYSGSFPANRSNALSSVINIKQAEGNKDHSQFRGSLGASEFATTLDGPIGDKTTYLFSYRRSYLQYLFKMLKLPFLPTFNDYQLRIKTRIGKKDELKLISVGSFDVNKLNTNISNPTESQRYILGYLPENDQWSYTIGLVYKHFAEKSNSTFVLSRNFLNNELNKYPENDETKEKTLDYKSQEIENKGRYEFNTNTNGFKIDFSIDGEYAKYNNDTKRKIIFQGVEKKIDYSTNLDFFKYGTSFQVSRKFIDEALSVSIGFRIDGNNYASQLNNPINQMSPRLAFKYSFNDKISANVSFANYYQLPEYTVMGYRENSNLVNKSDLDYIEATHYIVGMEYQPFTETIFTLEAFYKRYNNYPFSIKDSICLSNRGGEYDVVGNEEVKPIGEGRAYGFELMNRTKIKNRLNLTASYTFVISEFKDFHGKYIASSWDNRHILSLTSSVNLPNNWSIGTKWRIAGGLPYTNYDYEASKKREVWETEGQGTLDYKNLNASRGTTFNQLDIRVDKKYFFKKWSLMFYLDIQNILNSKYKTKDYLVRDTDSQGNYILTNNNTEYKLKYIKNESGSILPTIGIMVEF